jgi:PEGA domain
MLVAPGTHQIRIALPGYQTFETNINPLASQKVEIKTDLVKNGAPLAGPLVQTETSAATPRRLSFVTRLHSVETQPEARQIGDVRAVTEWKLSSLAEGRTCAFGLFAPNCYGDLCFGVFALSVEIKPSAAGGTCVS